MCDGHRDRYSYPFPASTTDSEHPLLVAPMWSQMDERRMQLHSFVRAVLLSHITRIYDSRHGRPGFEPSLGLVRVTVTVAETSIGE